MNLTVTFTGNSESSDEGEHDVKYFRRLLKRETNRLNNLSDKWGKIQDSTPGLTEEGKWSTGSQG